MEKTRLACSLNLEDIVKQISKTNCLPFIALDESWLKSLVHDAQLCMEDYNIHRCDRSTRVGGGVLLYTHRDQHIINAEQLDEGSW